jgi:AcrR family transcriptional regulator
MSKPQDIRIRTTQKMITKALIDLMKKEAFSKITVIDICTQAQIHRTTFYKHFEDKYQLLEFTLLDIEQKFDDFFPAYDAAMSDIKSYYLNAFRSILEFISQENDFFLNGIFYQENNYVNQVFEKTVYSYLIKRLKNDSTHYNVHFDAPVHIISLYYTGALISLTKWWLLNHQPVGINTLVSYFERIDN